MTDLELFLKYNMVSTKNYKKDDQLDYLLFHNKISSKRRTRKDHIVIVLEFSYNCNLNCIYCENQELRKKYNNAIITEETIRNIVKKVGKKLDFIQFHGGETLLVPKNILLALLDERNKSNHNFGIGFQTNSILYNKEIKELFQKNNIQIGFSYDGIFNSYNRGELSTQKILEVIKNNPNIQTINVITEENLQQSKDSLIKNYKYNKSLHLSSIRTAIVRPIVDSNNINNKNLINLNDNFVSSVLNYYEYWIKDINDPILDATIAEQILRLLNESRMCFDLYCFDGHFRIDPYGNIGACGSNLLEDNFGNINTINSFDDIIFSQKYLKTEQQIKTLIDKNCQNCIWFPSCNGGCMGTNYKLNSNYTQMDEYYCFYTNKILKGIFEIIKNIDLEKDKDKYNPYVIKILKDNNFYNLNEIKTIENKYTNGKEE